jgi:hypothetical protein
VFYPAAEGDHAYPVFFVLRDLLQQDQKTKVYCPNLFDQDFNRINRIAFGGMIKTFQKNKAPNTFLT